MFNYKKILFCSLLFFNSCYAFEFVYCYENQELFPFYLGTGEAIPDERPGITIELLRMAFQEMPEVKLSFRRASWKRCQSLLSTGAVNAVVASYSKEREEIGVYPSDRNIKVSENAYYLYIDKDSDIKWDGEKFYNVENKVFGVPSGFSIVNFLKEKNISVEETRTVESNLKKLADGKISAVVTLQGDADYWLEKESSAFRNIYKYPKVIQSKSYYFLMNHSFVKTFPELADKIWNTVSKYSKKYRSKLFAEYKDALINKKD